MVQYNIPSGCMTAMDTPFNEDGSIDWPGLGKNIEFQIAQKAAGVVPVATTGESPVLTEREHALVIGRTAQIVRKRCFLLAGCSSNSKREMLDYLEVAEVFECDGGLLVDCYYNAPSSLELRERYYRPAAERFPNLIICPYIIPSRTGCELSEIDLAYLAWKYPNVAMVKEATGNLERMKRTRQYTPTSFLIYSGDDDMTFTMLTDPEIGARGVISVIGNIAAGAIQEMCEKVFAGDTEGAKKIKEALDPLFRLVTIKKERMVDIPGWERLTVEDKFWNPDAIKTMKQGLGIPAGPRRDPLDEMTFPGVEEVRNGLRGVWENNPWVLKPIEDFYGVNISKRLADDSVWAKLSWKEGS